MNTVKIIRDTDPMNPRDCDNLGTMARAAGSGRCGVEGAVMSYRTMNTYLIPSWLRLGTPGKCQGQTVECSYGIDLQLGVAVRRTVDRSDGSESWALARLTDEEQDALEYYEAGGSDDEPNVAAAYETVRAVHET